jgi:hypothetical protein
VNLDNAEVFAAFAIAGAAALWRAASFQGEKSKEWGQRVEDSEVALEDRATTELLEMQAEITRVFGAGTGSPPRLATQQPGLLAEKASAFQKTLAVLSRLERDFRLLLGIGPLLVAAATTFLVGVVAVWIDNSELLPSSGLRTCGESVGGVGIALGLVLMFAYVALNYRLSQAEIRGRGAEKK